MLVVNASTSDDKFLSRVRFVGFVENRRKIQASLIPPLKYDGDMSGYAVQVVNFDISRMSIHTGCVLKLQEYRREDCVKDEAFPVEPFMVSMVGRVHAMLSNVHKELVDPSFFAIQKERYGLTTFKVEPWQYVEVHGM